MAAICEEAERKKCKDNKNKTVLLGMMAGMIFVAAVLLISNWWFVNSARRATGEAIDSLSRFYLKEMARRSSEAISNSLKQKAGELQKVVYHMQGEKISSSDFLRKRLDDIQSAYEFEFLAVADEQGEMYTAGETLSKSDYAALRKTAEGSREAVAAGTLPGQESVIVIAVNDADITVGGERMVSCFAGVDVDSVMVVQTIENQTHCNLLKRDGTYMLKSLEMRDLSEGSNLFTVLKEYTSFFKEYSLDGMRNDFTRGIAGFSEFYHNDHRDYIYYEPVNNTDWYVTMLISEDLVDNRISPITNRILSNSRIVMVVLIVSMSAVFAAFVMRLRANEKIRLEMVKMEEASRAKSTFLFNMSHDIRTPMNAIIGFTGLALKNLDNLEQMENYLTKIMASSQHLLSLINDVLDMSRIESGKMAIEVKECSLPETLQDLNTIIQGQVQEKNMELQMSVNDVRDENVYCDKLRLNQVLLNLISNALKFTPAGGKLFITLEQKKDAPEGHGTYEIRVRDTGIGMSPEFVKKVFEPFERENTSTVSSIQGTGLGMAITKNIIDMMGGTIEVHSSPGQGTEFVVTLTFPLMKSEDRHRVIPELKNSRVLVVDDDFQVCEGVTKMLLELGMRPEWTLSGKEAVLHAKVALDRKDGYEFFLIDWKLPDLGGIDVARQIREAVGENARIIVLTAYDWVHIENEAKEAGVSGFCTKPVFFIMLRDTLLEVMGEKPRIEEKEDAAQKNQEVFEGKRLLLVEDNELNREIAEEILEDAGFIVESVEDGSYAVEVMAGPEAGRFDAVLMDIQMPVMDGCEASRRIRSLENEEIAGIPIIAMTANAFEEDRQMAFAAGMNAHVAKPVDVNVLMETLAELLQ